AQAAWRADRHAHLLETPERERAPELAARRDCQEIGRFEAGAADQGAIDVGNRHQFRRVRGFHRTAIENTDPATLIVEPDGENTPDKAMNLLDILGGRRQPGADRP